ncbi:hypothetical protein TBLA_0A02450 [Henningerozyma blattae CBS 6284]|uniref:Large ribosomal subunit protein uL23m n=1 Tax=Henningerozyma blattae (strain ATCC 34711 / CBS 6284 / DSM 70876 / NBRC 10599 / NRRL Y-10934 / UCD 77-7) TaxID=1071380 RepID=I2GV92_HENB6|nr:hypothetical protein TBLA_0A02450 [Tetrapisispora blattae CBS 6284]CCH58044.1 hypothetical protein TBLA_0A02450 [Tetrapisispora blattae CBS 6284]
MPRVTPSPSVVSRVSERIFNRTREAIRNNLPHFRVGKTQLYFPNARVVLLRPNAKHTPYQAKFIVPKSFNKLDLRDYLYHVYGLRALNITTQLLHGAIVKEVKGRYRGPQIKKMTIEMEHPFIWPAEPAPGENNLWNPELNADINKHRTVSMIGQLGSNKEKHEKLFEGVAEPFEKPASVFIGRRLSAKMNNKKSKAKEMIAYQDELLAIEKRLQQQHIS